VNIIQRLRQFTVKPRKRVCIVIIVLVLFLVVAVVINYFVIGRSSKYILHNAAGLTEKIGKGSTVGIVPGGGIENGKPRPLLQDRLDAAARLLKTGAVRKLIVSGDNRIEGYNEPQAMKNYLTQTQHIDPSLIQLDNAGRSTYETCERAHKIFSLSKVLLISESTHLPRAIYLCRSFGIEDSGYSSDGASSSGLQVGQKFREIEARTKATINVYIIGERTVLGDKIKT
jgi:vancomycin permeability regulator SanA